MATFDDDYADAALELAAYYGGAATYYDAAGSDTALTRASVGKETVEVVESDGDTEKVTRRELRILVADLATVQLLGRVTLAGVDWSIENIDTSATWHVVTLIRAVPMEFAVGGYRTRQ